MGFRGASYIDANNLSLRAAPRAAQRRDEIERGGRRTLMQHLKERMLRVRPRLPPDDRRRGKIDALALERHRLAVAFHFQLLQVRRQAREALVVRQHRERRVVEGASFQAPMSPMMTGRLRSSGVFRK